MAKLKRQLRPGTSTKIQELAFAGSFFKEEGEKTMDMATLQLYKNRWQYPDYGSITAYGSSMQCTPVGLDLRSGTLRVRGEMSDFMSCNYLALTRDGQTIYAWIDNVKFRTEDSFDVTYTVDAWRTYRSRVTLGTQYIARSSQETFKLDSLLGSSQAYPEVFTNTIEFPGAGYRVFVVQLRTGGGEPFSSTPVQPSPYQFFMATYSVNNWQNNEAISSFMTALMNNAESTNIVTVYSIPYMSIFGLPEVPLTIKTKGGDVQVGGTWRFLNNVTDPNIRLSQQVDITLGNGINIDELLRVNHSVQVVVPEAGIISIPPELLKEDNLKLRQDIDLFSGASNYMVVSGINPEKKYGLSIRGSSISSIPILSDPMDTYLSQNQNALATSLIGDVASIVGGAAAMSTGAGAMAGAGAVASGLSGIMTRDENIRNIGNSFSNPPAYLGTALAGSFNGQCWVVVTRRHVDNANIVHGNFGYPLEKFDTLTFPGAGRYVKTEGCNVSSDGTVPRWAIDEINTMFNNGVLVH